MLNPTWQGTAPDEQGPADSVLCPDDSGVDQVNNHTTLPCKVNICSPHMSLPTECCQTPRVGAPNVLIKEAEFVMKLKGVGGIKESADEEDAWPLPLLGTLCRWGNGTISASTRECRTMLPPHLTKCISTIKH
eukprot:3981719-Amphidinium_carterae.2